MDFLPHFQLSAHMATDSLIDCVNGKIEVLKNSFRFLQIFSGSVTQISNLVDQKN